MWAPFVLVIFCACIDCLVTAQHVEQQATLGVLGWNVHYQCGAFPGCREGAAARFAQLARKNEVAVAVAIELELNATTPLDLPSNELPGWTQVAGSCSGVSGHAGDSLALLLAPGYAVLAQDGGCLNKLGDSARAFAVALVKPPAPLAECDFICVVGVHTPHQNITHGSDAVGRVCGVASTKCAVAVGDWNANINISHWPNDRPPLINPINVSQFWTQLAMGTEPLTVQAPDEVTCCYPETKYFGFDDHVITNIKGASLLDAHVLPYQLMHGGSKGNDTEEHKPIIVKLAFEGHVTNARTFV